MRKLLTGDLFAAMRIVKASNAKEALKPVLKQINKDADAEDVGIDVIMTLLECASDQKAEKAIYSFLSSPFEMEADDVANLPLNDLLQNMKELAKENDLAGFFSQLSDLITSK